MTTDSNWIFQTAQITINVVVYVAFIWFAFKNKMKCGPKIGTAAFIAYGVMSAAFIALFFNRAAPLMQFKLVGLILWVAISMFMSFVFLRTHIMQLLFLIFMIFSIQLNVMSVAGVLEKLDWLPHICEDQEIQFLFITIVVLIGCIPTLWYLSVRLFKRVVEMEVDRGYWKYLYLIPMTSFVCTFLSLMNNMQMSRKSMVLTLIATLSFCLFNLLSYAVVLKMLLKAHDSLKANQDAVVTKQQLLMQSEQYKHLAESISQTERMRHDLHHHFVTIKGYLSAGDVENASKYLDECIGKELPGNTAPICERHAVDMILRHYMAIARESQVKVQASVQLPKDFDIPDTDLCVIFGNIIENAVESCKRQKSGRKFISVNAQVINDGMLAIKVSNSYDGSIEKSNGHFLSRKHAGDGIGTNSIKGIVEKFGGTCKFTHENNIFTVSVLLIT